MIWHCRVLVLDHPASGLVRDPCRACTMVAQLETRDVRLGEIKPLPLGLEAYDGREPSVAIAPNRHSSMTQRHVAAFKSKGKLLAPLT